MENKDTINLLRECDAGVKMAVASIDQVLDKTADPRLKKSLAESKLRHERLGTDIHALLSRTGSDGKEPSPIAKGMSAVKTGLKMTPGDDRTAADLVTDGCDMGIKSLNRYMNKYKLADKESMEVCSRLVAAEEKLRDSLQGYL